MDPYRWFFVLLFVGVYSKGKSPIYKVKCSSNRMTVTMVYPDDATQLYLEHLKYFPEPKCKPEIIDRKATFDLNLEDIYECMVTRIMNKETGRKYFYHRIIMERSNRPKQVILVKCDSGILNSSNSSSYESSIQEVPIVKRAAQFPTNFQEPDYDIEITSEVTGRAPVPELNVEVRQSGVLIDGELTVKPGTPLSMDVFLDDESSDIYGLMVSNMKVSDTKSQEEALILNGCTVDPYLFENFITDDGDLLKAKFKAFKFPETNVVLFKGSVNVCLNKCSGVECANEEIGFGRRRRRGVSDEPSPQNGVYEVSMSTIIRVADDADESSSSFKGEAVFIEKPAFRGKTAVVVERAPFIHPDDSAIVALSEEFGAYKYIDFQGYGSSPGAVQLSYFLTLILCVLLRVVR